VKAAFNLLMSAILAPLVAQADGGTVRLREASGSFLVTVFTASEQLRTGPVDTSILIQDLETGRVVLDAAVNLALQPMGGPSHRLLSRATFSHANNKLLQAATINLPAPGWWAVQVFVRRGREEAVLTTKIFIMPATSRLTTIWPLLIFPPFAIGLYALNQRRRGKSLQHKSAPRGTR
jgi:hypothetical protein